MPCEHVLMNCGKCTRERDALRAALREMRDIARHFANVAGHPDDAVAIAVNARANEIMKERGL